MEGEDVLTLVSATVSQCAVGRAVVSVDVMNKKTTNITIAEGRKCEPG